eukprot:CAMPEP_0183293944 /NCGR_PEP_ID=MMETSP0160_2-20130417/2454_1 /TAXON_ID=2839 ORGANISM="Odontella Sinensis, Strain Grunow 1884" /NCGR_SAMPLE_ID=MMETSP0160_2 /ASSEMBLY_ACC=CAM_ASM_000250 /LENGTH=183 /DNA_ID=CAMNT_0025455161 /DNA_START=157 /DNA_END=708 /DNA_ORIENTATION=+
MMMKRAHICYMFLAFLLLVASLAPQRSCAEVIQVEEDHPLLSDPELLGAMEIFMAMSPEEREEAIRALMDAVSDDPVKQKEMEFLISKLPALEEEQIKNGRGGGSLKKMVQEDEFAKAKRNAQMQLGDTPWEALWENQAAILESVLMSGQLSPEDAARFKTDEEAWKAQLRLIWEDIQPGKEL